MKKLTILLVLFIMANCGSKVEKEPQRYIMTESEFKLKELTYKMDVIYPTRTAETRATATAAANATATQIFKPTATPTLTPTPMPPAEQTAIAEAERRRAIMGAAMDRGRWTDERRTQIDIHNTMEEINELERQESKKPTRVTCNCCGGRGYNIIQTNYLGHDVQVSKPRYAKQICSCCGGRGYR